MLYALPPIVPRENTTAVFAKLRADLELARIHADIPGMNIEVIHKGKLIFAEGYGERNKGIRLRLSHDWICHQGIHSHSYSQSWL